MKKSHLFLGIFTAIVIVIGMSGKAFVQPLPPPPPQNSPPPIQPPSQEQSLPAEKVPIPNPQNLLDIASNLVIQKYQNASCEDLSKMKPQAKNSSSTGGSQEAAQAKAIELFRQNPEIRKEFLNRVAPPIANKMFDCKVIP